MCGDTYCPSCGPAQGNERCYNCGAWSADGGCKEPDACEAALKEQERKMLEAEAEEELEMAAAEGRHPEAWAVDAISPNSGEEGGRA